MASRVLVVDDEPSILEFVEVSLKRAGFEVATAQDGASCLRSIVEDPPALVVLDVMLPDRDGFSVCKEIRKFSRVPVIMLTARGEDKDKITGLGIGADDYLVKPFNPKELVARIHAILRRLPSEGVIPPDRIRVGSLTIDPVARKVFFKGALIDLTPREHDVLVLLASHPGKVFSREELRIQLWGHEFGDERAIDTVVRYVREKIGDDALDPRYIVTVRHKGYQFTPVPPPPGR